MKFLTLSLYTLSLKDSNLIVYIYIFVADNISNIKGWFFFTVNRKKFYGEKGGG